MSCGLYVTMNGSSSSDRALAGSYDVDRLIEKVGQFDPAWLAFHGKTAAKAVSRALGHGPRVHLGEQTWRIAGARVFVLPSASGANRDVSRLEGKGERAEWFAELRRLAFSH